MYHLSPRALPAGYLGVDVFMVISGFIVTSLLLREHDRDGHVRIGAFWGRRFRRLVPALVFMLVIVATWARLVEASSLLPQIRAQGLSALCYLTNWELIRTSVTYGGATAAQSPFVHLWSLAVEEQFYLVWPLALVALLRLGRGRTGVAIVVSLLGVGASAALMAWMFSTTGDTTRAYYGTDTRAQAFLAGAVAALLAPKLRGVARRCVGVAGALALAAVVATMFITATDTFYRGGFAFVALATAIAAVATTVPGPVTRALDHRPLRGLGRVSYGVYLWHWPVIVLLTAARVGVGGVRLLGLRLAVIALATTVSWVLVERRFAGWRPRRVALRGALAMTVAAAAVFTMPAETFVAFANSRVDRVPQPTVAAPARAPASSASSASSPSAAHPAPTTTPAAVPLALPATGTAMLVGDSGMASATPAFTAALQAAGWRVVQTAFPGEGLTRPADVLTRWADAARTYHADLTIVMIGGWDLSWIQQRGLAAYRATIDDAFDAFTAGGGKVLWLSIMPGSSGANTADRGLDRWFAALAAAHPGVAQYLEDAPALEAPNDGGWPQYVHGQRYRMRDGWHLCPAGAAAFVHFTLAHVGLDRPGWDQGAWRHSSTYRDPWNACTP